MARFAVVAAFLLFGAAAAEDAACPDGACPADGEEAALLQKSFLQQQARENLSTPAPTLGCSSTPAATCGNADIKCFMDTGPNGCTDSGGGACCKAAGNIDGMLQCRFCGVSGCPACPTGPAPAPTTRPTPAPTIDTSCSTPGQIQAGGKCEAQSDGYWYGCCTSGLTCTMPANSAPGTYKRCMAPTPSPTIDYTCSSWGQVPLGGKCMAQPDGYWYGCCVYPLDCTSSNPNVLGSYKVCRQPTVWGR